jgi:hypothetical protein
MPRAAEARGITVTTMKTLSQYKNDDLRLEQPSVWTRVYHLYGGNEVLCTMSHPTFFGTAMVIEGFGQTWEFDRPRFWRPALEIKRKGQHLPFATFTPGKWGKGGTFAMPNGEKIQYIQSIWTSVNELHSDQHVRLLSLKRIAWWKRPLKVVIEHESDILDRNPWIVMVVYHLILDRQRHHG